MLCKTYCISAALALSVLAGSVGTAAAQSAGKIAASDESSCTDMDFLLGEWEAVRDGKVIANTKFEVGASHCSILQTWTPPSGVQGRSVAALIAYSNADKSWEYLAAWSNGMRQRWENGVLKGNELRFDRVDSVKKTLEHFSFFNLPNGDSKEFSEGSADGGKTWTTHYDVIFRRKK